MELNFEKRPKLRDYVWCYRRKWGKVPDARKVAWLGDRICIPFYKKEVLYQVADQLNLKIRTRKELTDYRCRTLPRIKIGNTSYYLLCQKVFTSPSLKLKFRPVDNLS